MQKRIIFIVIFLIITSFSILNSQEYSKNNKNLEHIFLLEPYTSYKEVIRKFDEPDFVVGSGFVIIQYTLPDGRKAYLNFGRGDKLYVLTEISIQGERNEIFNSFNSKDEQQHYNRNWLIPYSDQLPSNELKQKKLDALNGDQKAAMALMYHYEFILTRDLNESFKWRIVDVENGALEACYNLVITLLNSNIDNYELKNRGIFWLYTMAKVGYRIESTRSWLDRLGYTLDTATPPNDNLFPIDYEKFSDVEILNCKNGALKGNQKAALLLGKYYTETLKNNNLAEYWHRIGAQNGSSECMYKLGQIMINKDDELDHIRGRFWLEKAAKNGYTEE